MAAVGAVMALLIGMPAPAESAQPGTHGAALEAHAPDARSTVDPSRHDAVRPTQRYLGAKNLGPTVSSPTAPLGPGPRLAVQSRRRSVGSWQGFGQGTAFAGVQECLTCGESPDPWVAVGPDRVVQAVNSEFRITTKTGGLVAAFPLSALFNEPASQATDGDPRVVWDGLHGRWVASELSLDTSCAAGHVYISVSQTADPAGSWNSYRWDYAGELPDYPGLGITGDKVSVGINLYALDPMAPGCDSNTFDGASLIVADIAPLLAGTAGSAARTLPNPSIFTWRPAVGLTAGNTLFATFEWANAGVHDVGYAEVTGTNAGADIAIARQVDLTSGAVIAAFADPPPPRQPGSPSTIADGVDHRPTDALWQNGHLWFVSTYPCTPTGDMSVRACVRVTELGTDAGPSFIQDFLIGYVGSDSFMGGIGLSGVGRLFIVYSVSSPSNYISTYVDSQGPSDATYTTAGPILIQQGAASYWGQRWGDYVGVATDPVDAYAVWQADEYPHVTGLWATTVSRLAEDVIPPVGSVTINAGATYASSNAVNLSVLATDDLSGVSQVLVSNDSGMAGAVTLPYSTAVAWTLAGGDGIKTVYAQWQDGAGNRSPVQSDAITVDKEAPMAGGPPVQGFVAGTASGMSVRLVWTPGTDEASGVARYVLQRKLDSGAFVTIATTTTALASVSLISGHTYQFRVASVDAAGNASAFLAGPAFKALGYQESSTAVRYRGAWSFQTATSFYGARARYTRARSASATFTFVGRNLAWLAPTNRYQGRARVYVDGRLVTTITLYSAISRSRQIVLIRAWTVSRTHTLRIVGLATAGHPRVTVDAFFVLR